MSLAEEEQEEDLEVEELEEEEENAQMRLGTAFVVDTANLPHHCLKVETLVQEQVLVEG